MNRSAFLVAGMCLVPLVGAASAQPIVLEPSELFFYHAGELRQAVLAVVAPQPGTTLGARGGKSRWMRHGPPDPRRGPVAAVHEPRSDSRSARTADAADSG